MKEGFYRQRKHKWFAGVLAGISDRYGWDLNVVRALYVLFFLFAHVLALAIYFVFAFFLPYKEDVWKDKFGTGERKRKDADVIDDDKEGWFW